MLLKTTDILSFIGKALSKLNNSVERSYPVTLVSTTAGQTHYFEFKENTHIYVVTISGGNGVSTIRLPDPVGQQGRAIIVKPLGVTTPRYITIKDKDGNNILQDTGTQGVINLTFSIFNKKFYSNGERYIVI